MSKDLGSKFLIEEGLEDLDDMKNGFKRRLLNLGLTDKEAKEYSTKLRLQEKAKGIGLTYWPALYGKWDIDPMAYVYAERILIDRTGEVWGQYNEWMTGKKTRGGWDSEEHYGISARMVKQMWYSAGCDNNTKFQLQVEFGFVVGRRWNRHQALEILKGKRWLMNNGIHHWRFTERACWMLGRISAPLRRVAVSKYYESYHDVDVTIKPKDLDWVAVAKVQKDRIYNPKLDIILSGETRAKELVGSDSDLSKVFYPQYGELSWNTVQQLSTGTTPVELSEGNLSKKEAYDWLVSGIVHTPALDWYCRNYNIPYVREFKVAKWIKYLIDTNRWGAMSAPRTQYGAGGVVTHFTYMDVLDEVLTDDLDTGRETVAVVMARVQERQALGYTNRWKSNHEPLCTPPTWVSKLPEEVKYVNTPAQLISEGKSMEHCVGGYVSVVKNGSCHILSIVTPEGRSTVELNAAADKVVQHRGKANKDPVESHVQLVSEVMDRLVG